MTRRAVSGRLTRRRQHGSGCAGVWCWFGDGVSFHPVERSAAIAYCLSLPGAYLDHPWGPEQAVAKVGGKIFAFLGAPDGPLTIMVKNRPEAILEWRARYPEHAGPGPYLSKTRWNRVTTGGAGAPDDDEMRELIDDSYALIVAALPKQYRP